MQLRSIEEKIKTGCISWTYPDWLGSFYQVGTKSADFLSIYSRVFDIVEIDASFYRIPSPATVAQWKEKTPEGFLFTAKFPKKMTHLAKLKGIEGPLENFEKVMRMLGPKKLASILVQLPSSFKFDSGIEDFRNFLDLVDPKLRYAVEFRHASWLQEKEVTSLLKAKQVSLVWSVNDYVAEMPPEVTSKDFLYLRFMGKFGEFAKFDRIQKDRRDILETWCKKLGEKMGLVENVYVLVSNHFAGFAPDTVNQFRAAAGLSQIDWKERISSQDNAHLNLGKATLN